MASVGRAFGILTNPNFMGDRTRAQSFLDDMPATQRLLRNRAESRIRGRIAGRKNFKLGHKPKARRAL
jgi:hypothetical protein